MKPLPEITFIVEGDEDSSLFVASWDDPSGRGGITTQGEDLRELQDMVKEASTGYFRAAGVPVPSRVRLHFVTPSWRWRETTVISTEAQAGQWAERSGETSNFSSRGQRRWVNACAAPRRLRPAGKSKRFLHCAPPIFPPALRSK